MKGHHVKLKLMSFLSDGQFWSGEQLGSELGISRAAISKHIQGIRHWGIDIFRVPGKGYRLAHPLQLLDESFIQSQVNVPVSLFSVIDSTNQYLLEQIHQIESGSVCLAEYQEKGRGRRGRQWVSPFGCNLYLSMYWRLDAGIAAAMGLSLVIGVAVIDALESMNIEGVKLKWPNDLYYQDRKLAGILVEMSGQAGDSAHLVIGMGMNLMMHETVASQGIDQPWITLSEVAGVSVVDRNQFAIALIQSWENALKQYEKQGLASFVLRWNALDNFKDRAVMLIMGEKHTAGIARGINEQGALILETDEGLKAFVGGEISLKGAS